ncbi:unnamed protein product, partial [Polarella glacialis]
CRMKLAATPAVATSAGVEGGRSQLRRTTLPEPLCDTTWSQSRPAKKHISEGGGISGQRRHAGSESGGAGAFSASSGAAGAASRHSFQEPWSPAVKFVLPEESSAFDRQTSFDRQRSGSSDDTKGAISMLQEFVQYSKGFHLPPRCPILQWSYDTRMADYLTLEFRATVGFLLEGVPHYSAGEWHQSKKIAQRDAAERALGLLVGCWGEYLAQTECAELSLSPSCSAFGTPSTAAGGPSIPNSPATGGPSMPNSPDRPRSVAECAKEKSSSDEFQLLEHFCRSFQTCDAPPPQWNVSSISDGCFQASVEIELLGVQHKFSAGSCNSEEAAYESAAKRVLWYLNCPGFESSFEPPDFSAVAARDMPMPPPNWASDAAEEDALQVAERKTCLMRLQNRLQQALARDLRPGQSVWEWSYESDPDAGWPLLCRAKVSIPVISREFVGAWARGQRNAQIALCGAVASFLDSYAPPSPQSQQEEQKEHRPQKQKKKQKQMKKQQDQKQAPPRQEPKRQEQHKALRQHFQQSKEPVRQPVRQQQRLPPESAGISPQQAPAAESPA